MTNIEEYSSKSQEHASMSEINKATVVTNRPSFYCCRGGMACRSSSSEGEEQKGLSCCETGNGF